MGLAVAIRTDTEVQLVCSLDPDVDAPEGVRGWFPKTQAARLRPGADVITVHPLKRDVLAQCLDEKGARMQGWSFVVPGIVAVGKSKAPSDIDDWVQNPAIAFDVLLSLGWYIRDISMGIDPSLTQLRVFPAPNNPAPAEPDDPGNG